MATAVCRVIFCAILVLCALPGDAQGRPRGLELTPGVVSAPLLPLGPETAIRDRAGAAAAASVGKAGRPYRESAGKKRRSRLALRPALTYKTVTGQRIRIAISERYDSDPDADLNLVNYLDSLVHGAELDGLRVVILTVKEIAAKCGERAAACYFPRYNTMVIVGESQVGGLPTNYVIAHEYGHRIAQFRRNPPFPGGAFWFGTKRWATRGRVCPGVRRGLLSIGSGSYWEFPGENFAEAYAALHHPGLLRWQFAPSLRPTEATANAIRRDVLDPWRRPPPRTVSGVVAPGRPGHHRIATPLDGRLTLTLAAPRGARLDLSLSYRGRRLKQLAKPAREAKLSHVICGERQLTARVGAAVGSGRYRLTVSAP